MQTLILLICLMQIQPIEGYIVSLNVKSQQINVREQLDDGLFKVHYIKVTIDTFIQNEEGEPRNFEDITSYFLDSFEDKIGSPVKVVPSASAKSGLIISKAVIIGK